MDSFTKSVLLLALSRLFPGVQSFDGHSERDKQHPPKARETSLELTDKQKSERLCVQLLSI